MALIRLMALSSRKAARATFGRLVTVAVLALACHSDLDSRLDSFRSEAGFAAEDGTWWASGLGGLSVHAGVATFDGSRWAEGILGNADILRAEFSLELESSRATEIAWSALGGEAEMSSTERALDGGGLEGFSDTLVALVVHSAGTCGGGCEGSLKFDLALLAGNLELSGLGHVSGSIALASEHTLADVRRSAIHLSVFPAATLSFLISERAASLRGGGDGFSDLTLTANQGTASTDLYDASDRVGLTLSANIVSVGGAEPLSWNTFLDRAARASRSRTGRAFGTTLSWSQTLVALENAGRAEQCCCGRRLSSASLSVQLESTGTGVHGCGSTLALSRGKADEGEGNKGSHWVR